MTNKDKTGTARQQARRKREKEWLSAHGFTSWEQLHTKLMSGEIIPYSKDIAEKAIAKVLKLQKGKQS